MCTPKGKVFTIVFLTQTSDHVFSKALYHAKQSVMYMPYKTLSIIRL